MLRKPHRRRGTELEPLDRGDRTGWSTNRSGAPVRARHSSERRREKSPVVDQLEAVQADEPEALVGHVDRNRDPARAEIEAVADRVRARVDDLAARQIPGRPRAGRVVDRRHARCDRRFSSSGKGWSRSSCGGRPRCARPARAACAPSGRRAPSSSCRRARATSGCPGAAAAPAAAAPLARERPRHRREPAGDVGVRCAGRGLRAAAEPESGCGRPNWSSRAGICCTCCPVVARRSRRHARGAVREPVRA